MTPQHHPWPYNPLVTLIRQYGTEIVNEVMADYETKHGFKASAFDLAVQTMIVACSYEPEEIWYSANGDVGIAKELVSKGAAGNALEILESGIAAGKVALNGELIKSIAVDQLEKLHQLHDEYRKEINNLPMYGDRALSAFKPDAELNKFQLTDTLAENGLYQAIAIEKVSKDKVVFKPVDLKLSKAYIESFHYLHAARDDDTLAFGAFAEGEKIPYAIVTYAPVGREYKHKMLATAGIDPELTIELTRAWNCENSPKNTMSLLYAYAHANIQRIYLDDKKQALTVVTAVNPNLGFKGSAFRAVGFGLIGHKPTSFNYIIAPSGKRSFVTRRDLSAMLDSALGEIEHTTAHFPLLPTKELAVHLHGSKRLRHTGSIYDVDDSEYSREVPSLS